MTSRVSNPFSDAAFQKAMSVGRGNLYYELCRRLAKRSYSWKIFGTGLVFGIFFLVSTEGSPIAVHLIVAAVAAALVIREYGRRSLVPVEGWFKGPLLKHARERLLDGLTPYGLFKRTYLEDLLAGRMAGLHPRRRQDLDAGHSGVLAPLNPKCAKVFGLMKAGIIGLQTTGKTTIFNVLSQGKAAGAATGRRQEANVAIVKVPDSRLDFLSSKFTPEKTTFAVVEFVDVPALTKGRGQDVVLAPLRTVDVLIHVIRTFEDESVPHPAGSVDPERDRRDLNYELMLADIGSIEKRMERLEKDLKKGKTPALTKELSYLERAKTWLESEKPLREMQIDEEEKKLVKGFAFLSEKPMIEVYNIGEDQLARLTEMSAQKDLAANTDRTVICGKLEAEMAELPPEELRSFLKDYGLTESGAERLIRTTYRLLGLISFFTVGEEECRAWTITDGTNAQRAAGVIHTDLQDHFIRAEVCGYDDFVKHGSHHALKEKGLLRLEGKDYIVKDGDIMEIRHSG